jgi:hypothetical protein
MDKDPLDLGVDLRIVQFGGEGAVGATWPRIHPHCHLLSLEWLDEVAGAGSMMISDTHAISRDSSSSSWVRFACVAIFGLVALLAAIAVGIAIILPATLLLLLTMMMILLPAFAGLLLLHECLLLLIREQ